MSVRIVVGDVRQTLPTLPEKSVRCCVTSPPYFGLRDYGTAAWSGGDASCSHVPASGSAASTLGGGKATQDAAKVFRRVCGHCGAIREDQQIGLEQTPAEYVAQLVAVFREVRRVLADDGTLWLNIGDSYARTAGDDSTKATDSGLKTGRTGRSKQLFKSGNNRPPAGMKAKDLIGIPWMVAFALRADGWYLRSDIIWHKPNPMPESVTDRPTKAHEYLFLLSKSERYYYDADAIAEEATTPDKRMVDGFGNKSVNGKHAGDKQSAEFRRASGLTGGTYAPPGQAPHSNARENKQDALGKRTYTGFNESVSLVEPSLTRNSRTVWTIATSPYKEAHFATFPAELPERCIKAGSATGDTILDPFGGAGTTGLVADRLGRSAILCELNPKYAKMADDRIHNDAPLFADVERT